MSVTFFWLVAIASNLGLVLVNCILWHKIRRWHQALRLSRQRFIVNERKIQTVVESLRQQTELIPATTQHIRTKKQQGQQVIAQIKLLQQLLRALVFMRRQF
ncbi:hypothetical protein NIES970_09900 [[Synechococcus] sp. NIES-970]|uniref:hypothetical protein n=1 Tax=Picosynechococcus sp. NKBG15041c TaxID=1407650 RepID=UPI000415E82D|nr:hypothetical protein [Picosynechococcus sp. NKBG15041c]BAW96069.1 hypothetical protein NIES970_09900 [[Synechococcus] sp. NIES-970]